MPLSKSLMNLLPSLSGLESRGSQTCDGKSSRARVFIQLQPRVLSRASAPTLALQTVPMPFHTYCPQAERFRQYCHC